MRDYSPQPDQPFPYETCWQALDRSTAIQTATAFFTVLVVVAGLVLMLWWEYRAVTKKADDA